MEAIVKYFLLPSGMILTLVILGFILLFIRKAKRIGFYLLLSAGVLYVFFGTGPVSFWLLGNLEYQYPFVMTLEASDNAKPIVVLAGHAEKDASIPISSNVNSSTAFRLIEAVRLLQKNPESEIIVSGNNDVAHIMKQLLVEVGIPADKVVVENQSTSTYESALFLKDKLMYRDFFLVTSAGHMPRAMGVFTKQHLNPLPAPTDYMSRKNYMAISYLPSPLHLYYSDLAVHEYLGILWYKLTGRL
jgi:uncharacterized SAM-binding protein YcdF (DUF218 family)